MVFSLCSLKFFGPFNKRKKLSFFFFNLRMISFFCMEICSQGIKSNMQCFETRPGPEGRPGTRPTRGWNQAGLMKKLHKPWPGVTRRVDPVTRQNPVKNPVATHWLLFLFLFFFTKTTSFWIFFKIEIDPADPVKTRWLDQNLEPGPWIGLATGPGLKTLLIWEIGLKLWLPRNMVYSCPINFTWRTILSFDLILDIMGFFWM